MLLYDICYSSMGCIAYITGPFCIFIHHSCTLNTNYCPGQTFITIDNIQVCYHCKCLIAMDFWLPFGINYRTFIQRCWQKRRVTGIALAAVLVTKTRALCMLSPKLILIIACDYKLKYIHIQSCTIIFSKISLILRLDSSEFKINIRFWYWQN